MSAPDDEFVLHGGRRSKLRNRAVLLVVVAVIGVAVLINALQQAKGDSNGSSGNLVIPAAVAIACLGWLAITISQWWEDSTFLAVDGDRLLASHGTGARHGRATAFAKGEPIVITHEGAADHGAVFASQGDARIRLCDAMAMTPLQASHLDSWVRLHGFAIERG
ncbi:hypothetical protein [Demequina sp.]|uniref:hypothetical protein n=1 Tax=Demequina sp. TaxID=2050685 RepID=UPI003D0B835A